MNADLTRAMVEARSLAQDKGWEKAAEAAEAVLTAHLPGSLLLVTPTEGEIGGLPRWMAETVPALRLQKMPITELAADPMQAAISERVAILQECGKMLSSETVETIAQTCFSRPHGSYVIVMRGAEQIETAEDLELVERAVFRLLVPEPKSEWNHQNLRQFGCYLWSDAAPAEFLAERLRADREALADWLRRPAHYGQELEIQQAITVLELAETEIPEKPDAPQEESLLSAKHIYQTLDDLNDMRRRFFARLDAEAPSIERQLTASLLTLEQNLLAGVRAHLQLRLPQFDPSREEAKLKSIVAEYISVAAQKWQQEAKYTLLSRTDTIQADTDAILRGMDWRVINALANQQGTAQDYPEALLKDLLQPGNLDVLGGGSASQGFSIDRTGSGISIRNVVVVAAIAGGAALLGGPIGLIAAGATLVAGAVKYKEDSMSLCEEMARKMIQATFQKAITGVQQQTRETLKPLRTRLTDRFRQLEEMLDHALESSRLPSIPAPAEDPDRRQIQEIRQRILTLAAESGPIHNEQPPFGQAPA